MARFISIPTDGLLRQNGHKKFAVFARRMAEFCSCKKECVSAGSSLAQKAQLDSHCPITALSIYFRLQYEVHVSIWVVQQTPFSLGQKPSGVRPCTLQRLMTSAAAPTCTADIPRYLVMQVGVVQENRHRVMDLRAGTESVEHSAGGRWAEGGGGGVWEQRLKVGSQVAAEARAAVKVTAAPFCIWACVKGRKGCREGGSCREGGICLSLHEGTCWEFESDIGGAILAAEENATGFRARIQDFNTSTSRF